MSSREKGFWGIHQEGLAFLVGANVLLIGSLVYLYINFESKVAFWIWLPCVVTLLILSFNFYRIPRRQQLDVAPNTITAATDGVVVVIERVYEPEILKRECIQVSTFMTIFNVHAQWFPIAGRITYVKHHEGSFMSAYLPKSSLENERATVVIETENGQEVLVRQIAGAVARRIITYAEEGEICHPNDPLGFIKFGSRVDLYLPLDCEVKVALDQKVKGNETIMALLRE